MIVVDASAVVDLLLTLGAWERIADRMTREGELVRAPHLLDVEVLQTLRRRVLRRQVSPERAAEVLVDLADLRILRYPHLQLRERIWELRHNLSVADATYVALAEALDAPLITADEALARAPGHIARVEVFR